MTTYDLDPYYTLDVSLFDGTFRHFSNPVQVHGKVHTEQETYRQRNATLEPVPISIKQGERTYLHIRPFVLVPDIILIVGLYPQPTPEGAIGEVVSSRERKMKEVEVGNAQAWYYPDGTIVLWECFLDSFVRDHLLNEDPNMRAWWLAFEHFLCKLFAEVSRIVTTSHDSMFATDEYQRFLHSLGYERGGKAVYGKSIKKEA